MGGVSGGLGLGRVGGVGVLFEKMRRSLCERTSCSGAPGSRVVRAPVRAQVSGSPWPLFLTLPECGALRRFARPMLLRQISERPPVLDGR
jgi:hypothetical protein